MRVHSFYAQSIGRFFAADDVVDMGDFGRLQIGGVRRTGFRVDQTTPAVDKIFGAHRLAIAPFGIIAQAEAPDFVVFAFPRLSQRRLDFAFFIGLHQAVEQIADDVDFGDAGNLVRV